LIDDRLTRRSLNHLTSAFIVVQQSTDIRQPITRFLRQVCSVSKEFSGGLEIALLVRVRHAGAVHPRPGPLDRLCEIDWIFDDTGIDQALAIRTQPEAFSEPFLRAAWQ